MTFFECISGIFAFINPNVRLCKRHQHPVLLSSCLILTVFSDTANVSVQSACFSVSGTFWVTWIGPDVLIQSLKKVFKNVPLWLIHTLLCLRDRDSKHPGNAKRSVHRDPLIKYNLCFPLVRWRLPADHSYTETLRKSCWDISLF